MRMTDEERGLLAMPLHEIPARRYVATTRWVLLTVGLPALLSCGQDEPVVTYTAPKDPPAIQPAPAPASASIHWDLPAGWKQVGGQGPTRYATLALDDHQPALVLSISALPPQNLLANVNRWQDQVGAERASADQLDRFVRPVDMGPQRADIVDVTGPSQRILGAFLDHEGVSWCFKIQGGVEQVAAQEGRFETFLRSVRF